MHRIRKHQVRIVVLKKIRLSHQTKWLLIFVPFMFRSVSFRLSFTERQKREKERNKKIIPNQICQTHSVSVICKKSQIKYKNRIAITTFINGDVVSDWIQFCEPAYRGEWVTAGDIWVFTAVTFVFCHSQAMCVLVCWCLSLYLLLFLLTALGRSIDDVRLTILNASKTVGVGDRSVTVKRWRVLEFMSCVMKPWNKL